MGRGVKDEKGMEHLAICIFLLQGESVSPNCREKKKTLL